MATTKKLPPEDVIVEDSGPTKTDLGKKPDVEIDVDDAQIEEADEDAFKK